MDRFPLDMAAPVMLAPMAGITDLPFRTIVSEFGASLVVSEMVASHDMLNARPGSREKAGLGLGAAGTAVQWAGREPLPMAEAARMVAGQGARVIDINMGCRAKKGVNGDSGAALMREPDHAWRLSEAVVGAVDIPVTRKTRQALWLTRGGARHLCRHTRNSPGAGPAAQRQDTAGSSVRMSPPQRS